MIFMKISRIYFLGLLMILFSLPNIVISKETLLPTPKPVSITLHIIDKQSGSSLNNAKVFFFEDQSLVISNQDGIVKRTISTKKDSISFRVQAQGFTSIIQSIPSQESIVTIGLSPLYAITTDIIVRAQKQSSITASTLENIQESAIYEGKKTELIRIDLLQSNTATSQARQIFSRVPGLNIWESDQAGLQLGIGGRGLSPNRTAHFNTRMNGYDLSADALGYPENYFTPPMEFIDRIEIVRGAASLQYGPQFGGLINMKLKQGSDSLPFNVQTSIYGGSYGLFNGFCSVGGTLASLQYYSGISYKRGDGWRKNSGFDAITSYSSLTYSFSNTFTVTADISLHHALSQQPGGLSDAHFLQNPRESFRSRNWFSVDWNINAVQLLYEISPLTRIQSRFFNVNAQRSSVGNLQSIITSDEGIPRTLIDGVFNNYGNETRLLHTLFINDNPANLLLGIRVYNGNSIQKQGIGANNALPEFTFKDSENPETMMYKNPGRNYAVFSELVLRPTTQWSIIPGIRYEYISTNTDGWYKDRIIDLAGNIISERTVQEEKINNRSIVLFGIGSSYHIDESHELYANISRNYRAMTFSDMRIVNPNLIIDTSLKDESGFNADIGLKLHQFNGLLFADISAFYLQYDNRIGTILMSDKAPFYIPYRYRTNIGTSKTYGIESVIEADIAKILVQDCPYTVKTYMSFSLLRGIYTESKEASIIGKMVEQVPPYTIRTGIEYSDTQWKLSMQYSIVAEHYTDATNAIRTGNATIGIIPQYSVMDISARYSPTSQYSIECHINNALNASYFTRRAESYPGPGILPSDPLNLTLGIVITL